nr:photosystem I P700 apoprotein A2, chloroplastic [Tanacetum cinerariifolium]
MAHLPVMAPLLLAIAFIMLIAGLGIGPSFEDLHNMHDLLGARLGPGHRGGYDTINNSLHFQLGLALASLGVITSLVAQHILSVSLRMDSTRTLVPRPLIRKSCPPYDPQLKMSLATRRGHSPCCGSLRSKPIDYAILNQLSTDFNTRFVPQTESSAEQAFWSQYSVQTDEPNLSGTIIVEVSKELPKVSMVNSCLKKLKFRLASFDMVVKERTTATSITEGTWGFEHTKACFRDAIIPFVKNLKELVTSFDQCLIDEVTEVQNIFKQMELAVEQHCAEKTKFQTKMEKVLQENDRLLTQALSVEIVNTVLDIC